MIKERKKNKARLIYDYYVEETNKQYKPQNKREKEKFLLCFATKVTSLIDYLIHHSRLIKHIMMVQYMQKKGN